MSNYSFCDCKTDSNGVVINPDSSAYYVEGDAMLLQKITSIVIDSNENIGPLSSRLKILFQVDTDGSALIKEINGKSSNSMLLNSIEKAILKQHLNTSGWTSGVCNGNNVKSYYTLNYYINLR